MSDPFVDMLSKAGGPTVALLVLGFMCRYFMGQVGKLQDLVGKQSEDYLKRLEIRDKEHAECSRELTLALHDLKEAILGRRNGELSNPGLPIAGVGR